MLSIVFNMVSFFGLNLVQNDLLYNMKIILMLI